MIYLLLIFFPIAMGAGCFVLRTQTRLVIAAAVATVLAQIALVLQLPLDQPARLLGLTLTLDPLGRLFLLTFLAVGALALLATWRIPHGENFVPIALMLLGMTSTTLLLLQEPFVASLLLISTGLLAVLAIVDLPTASSALVGRATLATALKYLVLMLIAGVMMYMGFVLVNAAQPNLANTRISPTHLVLALAVVGFGLRLAIVPFHSWLPDLAEDAAPMVSVLVVAVVNVTSLLFLIVSFQLVFYPFEVVGGPDNQRGMQLLLALGIITALLGALLALAQTSIRRTIGYLVVYDAGMVLFGLATMDKVGVTGALFEAWNQTIVVLLLFVSIGLLERPDGRPANVLRHDLLWRWPVAGTGLLGGGLALLGLPPFNGFASKLLLYEAAARKGGLYLVLLLLASALALLALVRLARERLFGSSEEQRVDEAPVLLGTTDLDRPADRRLDPEPRGMALLTALLLAVCLAIGLYPQPLLSTINEVSRGLTFFQPF
ncbi:MAG TPA: proton-conducting transporter membrane subunit [Kouleothrix sp.]|uniref:proton-conducting transporter transmembrane domain-containing protein n=1 Tax=Kouleothrix sp. TaxID=2779161 RepID=UPI002BA5B2A3|nr:proton-conducting transporter membrane subunit [Kouleothrix sp.]HRC77206.1 proton-conducting transporter membrane subunit [Kouleothrix sp.]